MPAKQQVHLTFQHSRSLSITVISNIVLINKRLPYNLQGGLPRWWPHQQAQRLRGSCFQPHLGHVFFKDTPNSCHGNQKQLPTPGGAIGTSVLGRRFCGAETRPTHTLPQATEPERGPRSLDSNKLAQDELTLALTPVDKGGWPMACLLLCTSAPGVGTAQGSRPAKPEDSPAKEAPEEQPAHGAPRVRAWVAPPSTCSQRASASP